MGIQLIQNKLYLDGKLCVPENRTEPLLLAFHVETGHPGQQRLILAANSKFIFAPKVNVAKVVQSM